MTGTVASAKLGFEWVTTKSSRRGIEIAQGIAAQPGPVDGDTAAPAGLDWKLTMSIDAHLAHDIPAAPCTATLIPIPKRPRAANVTHPAAFAA